MLGDKAFKLTTTFMTPYPHKQAKADKEKAVYNYQHCLAGRTCENAFGILCQYCRIFFSTTAVYPETTVLIVLGGLHGLEFLNGKMLSPSCDEASSVIDLPQNIRPMPRRKENADFEAYNIRDQFQKYFCSCEG
jgi:hypothetical protein